MSGCLLSQSHLERGKNHLHKKNYVKAIRELEQAANEEGNTSYYIDVYSNLGDSYAQNREPVKAVSIYRNALQIIHLKIREISSQRRELRRGLHTESDINRNHVQEDDMRLADEEWQLKERGERIKIKMSRLKDTL